MKSCCKLKPVVSFGSLMCRKHFLRYFEDKVKHTVSRFRLFEKKDLVAVACSGGKDSTAVLHILKKLGYNVEALAVDEGIKGYRNKTLEDLKRFCRDNKINLRIASFMKEFGFSLDELIKKKKIGPCMACGVLRRYLLNKASRRYELLVTGHNLDDEAQSIIMNLMKSNTHLLPRLGPKTGQVNDSKFTQRVKPLYLCSEKEVASYVFLKGFNISFNECPYAVLSFRASVRDMLNRMEADYPGTKIGIVNSFLKMLPLLKNVPISKRLNYCASCGEPSSRDVCNACNIIKKI